MKRAAKPKQAGKTPAKGDGHAASCDRRHAVLCYIRAIAFQHQAGTCINDRASSNFCSCRLDS